MTSTAATRGRPRRHETDEQILSTARDLMRERGPAAVSVASVSDRSGIARTTIYRRYQNRETLLRAALEPVAERGGPPPGIPVGEKVGWVLARTEEVLDGGIGRGGVAAVLAGTDPEFSVALRASLERGLRPILDQIDADISAGTLATDTDADTLLNLILGSYLAESLRRGTPDARWRRRTATALGRALAGPDSR